MSAKEKQGFSLYFLIAFGLAWLCQVGGCMALLQQKNAVLYQLALIATMFCPLLAVLLVQKVFLRQPVGIGWKVQGKRRFWLAAWFQTCKSLRHRSPRRRPCRRTLSATLPAFRSG